MAIAVIAMKAGTSAPPSRRAVGIARAAKAIARTAAHSSPTRPHDSANWRIELWGCASVQVGATVLICPSP
jgi:hypothetical protein